MAPVTRSRPRPKKPQARSARSEPKASEVRTARSARSEPKASEVRTARSARSEPKASEVRTARGRSRAASRSGVVRFSVSLPPDLASDLDAMVASRGLPSRSSAVAEMVRRQLVRHRVQLGRGTLAGTITLVYKNAGNSARTRLTEIQRKYLKETISSQHVFLEDDHSLEVLLVQGPGDVLRDLCNELASCRGVEQAELALTATLLPPLH
jgi:CopG family transcriptional regulator, nickel-responsive regulator